MASISIFSDDRHDHWKIERNDFEDYTQSQQFAVSVVQGNFAGSVLIWCGESDLFRFVAQLRECERLRRGEANLKALSSQEFSLRIWNTRSKGDFALAYEINDYSCSLIGEFELDPSMLRQILRDFEALLDPAQGHGLP